MKKTIIGKKENIMELYWYCGVRVKGIVTVYSYISDNGEIPVGSYVKVPFGQKNTPVIGRVETGGEYTEENAPYPVSKTKHILCMATSQEYEEQASIPPYDYTDDGYDDIGEVNFYIANGAWNDVLEWAWENEDCPYEPIAKKVVECYELCMERGMPYAALYLGDLYSDGILVEQDHKKASELYKIAADAGVERAIRNCGAYFYDGRHREIDYAEAFKYFSLGALLHGDVDCLCKLGDVYLHGQGTDKNERYAFLLYERASKCHQESDEAEKYVAEAQLRVGMCWLKGIGVEADAEKAHTLLTSALLTFYKRRKTDHSVADLINAAKGLIAEAQKLLDKETSDHP